MVGRLYHLGRRRARERSHELLASFDLADAGDRLVRTYSGGMRRRLDLGASLVGRPQVLFLDEPLAALDAATRTEVRRDLRRHLASFDGTRLLVTHDPLEAIALADRLVVLEAGRLTQTGTPAEVSAQPRSRYVAELVGVNLYRGLADGRSVRLPDGGAVVAADLNYGEVFAAIHPHAVALHRQPPEGTPRNVWSGTADTLEVIGDRVRIRVTGLVPIVAEVTPAAASELHLGDGGPVWATVKATEVTVYPA